MSTPPTDLGATNERLTFRTFREYVRKLRIVAEAHNLRLGKRLSLGAALNMIIGSYDASAEEAAVAGKKKKGSKQ